MNAALYAELLCGLHLCASLQNTFLFLFFFHPCVFWKFSICLLYSLSGIRHLRVYKTVQKV